MAIVAVAQLASSCCFSLTRAVWGDEEEGKLRAVAWVEATESREFQVGLAAPVGSDERDVTLVVWTDEGADRDGASTWLLKSRDGGELLEKLLEPAAFATEVTMAIEVVSDREHGDPAWASAAIEVRGRLRFGALGSRVDQDALAEPTRRALAVLAERQRDAFAEPRVDGTFADRSARQACGIDPRLLAAAGSRWVVFESLLLDAAGLPWPPRAEDAAWSPSEERAALAGASIALLATDGTESGVWLVPADLAVLGGRLHVDDDGGFVHRSQWSFAPIAPRQGLAAIGGAGSKWPMRLVERDLGRGLKKDNRSLGAKLLLTPPAVLVDLLFGWLLDPLGMWKSVDDAEDERKRRR